MQLTKHASERVLGRTKMAVEDVLELVSARAVVELGAVGSYCYLLFYSPFDQRTKIAVTTRDRGYLISILECDFKLPSLVSEPNAQKKNRAHQLYKNFIFERVVPGKAEADYCEAVIRVKIGHQYIYKHEVGRIPRHEANQKNPSDLSCGHLY